MYFKYTSGIYLKVAMAYLIYLSVKTIFTAKSAFHQEFFRLLPSWFLISLSSFSFHHPETCRLAFKHQSACFWWDIWLLIIRPLVFGEASPLFQVRVYLLKIKASHNRDSVDHNPYQKVKVFGCIAFFESLLNFMNPKATVLPICPGENGPFYQWKQFTWVLLSLPMTNLFSMCSLASYYRQDYRKVLSPRTIRVLYTTMQINSNKFWMH